MTSPPSPCLHLSHATAQCALYDVLEVLDVLVLVLGVLDSPTLHSSHATGQCAHYDLLEALCPGGQIAPTVGERALRCFPKLHWEQWEVEHY